MSDINQILYTVCPIRATTTCTLITFNASNGLYIHIGNVNYGAASNLIPGSQLTSEYASNGFVYLLNFQQSGKTQAIWKLNAANLSMIGTFSIYPMEMSYFMTFALVNSTLFYAFTYFAT